MASVPAVTVPRLTDAGFWASVAAAAGDSLPASAGGAAAAGPLVAAGCPEAAAELRVVTLGLGLPVAAAAAVEGEAPVGLAPGAPAASAGSCFTDRVAPERVEGPAACAGAAAGGAADVGAAAPGEICLSCSEPLVGMRVAEAGRGALSPGLTPWPAGLAVLRSGPVAGGLWPLAPGRAGGVLPDGAFPPEVPAPAPVMGVGEGRGMGKGTNDDRRLRV